MKQKILIYSMLVAAACLMPALANAQFVVRHNGTSSTQSSDQLFFSQKGSSDNWSFTTVQNSAYQSAWDISKIQYITTQKAIENATDPEVALDNYEAPAYADDYRSISAWSNRSQWNLSNVHDPTVMLAEDGYYYMYQTDASYGNAHTQGGHFHCRRSQNLVDWEYLGGTMQAAPAWVKDSLNSIRTRLGLPIISNPTYGYWAPCARKVADGLYRMYYCIVVDNYIKTGKANTSDNFDNSWTERAFIGMMETSTPWDNDSWEDRGYVVCSSSDRGTDWSRSSLSNWNAYFKFNAIDPTYIVTPDDEHWLIYGSWHCGFAALQLNGETGKPLVKPGESWGTADDIAAYGKLIYTRRANSRWQAAEAPEVVYRNGWYYLFMAFDELSVAYNTRVVRSRNIDGPYEDMYGNYGTDGGAEYPILTHPYKFADGYGWVGISHCAVFDDGEDNWYYASQQRLPATAGGNAPNAVMMGGVRSIRWTEDDWPVVMPERYGAVPQLPITEADIVGTWEHIDLSYKSAQQRESSEMTFGENHKITDGIWKGGSWSFDPETNVLTANGVKCYLQRECDWEASPRKATIVYSAHGNKKSYWGKKK